ncbi:MAG: glycerate kinase [bacterium]|nr:glycerate kinase [bacterium]
MRLAIVKDGEEHCPEGGEIVTMKNAMKIVIALDSFKGTLTSREACVIVAESITRRLAAAELVIKPMADGGEGTARALIEAAGGTWISCLVMGPFPEMEVEAGFAWFPRESTALVEMAAASGLELVPPGKLDPLRATTYGTGQLIRAANKYGARRVLLAIGGSATVDAGTGAALALGWQFLDGSGEPVPLGGAGLECVDRIVRPSGCELAPVEILCDVDNPLLGELGAARIYGPQKGATPEMVEHLERGLSHLAGLIETQLGRDIRTIPGAGAAGGLGAGAVAFMNGRTVSGIKTVMSLSGLKEELAAADWVITGEGSFDCQSLMGKVVSGVVEMARETSTRVAVIAGQVTVSADEYRAHGIETALSCRGDDMPLSYALENSRDLLSEAAGRFVCKCLAET